MPTVLQLRGTSVEAVHPFSFVAVRGEEVQAQGGPPLSTTWRSAAKPFQLAASLELLDDPSLSDEELAVGAASHGGEARHVELVERLLARFELTPAALRCGAHPPLHAASAQQLWRAGAEPSALHNNCSGKHTFMLAATRRQGWPLDYLPASHPLQQRILQLVTEVTQRAPTLSVDGCGVPTFEVELQGLARAWALLARSMACAPAPGLERRLHRIGWAMAREPEHSSGEGRLDAAVVLAAREPVAVKVGALGVYCLALPERELGVALKIHDGASDALPAAVEATLEAAAPGALPSGLPRRWREILSVAGSLVGSWKVS